MHQVKQARRFRWRRWAAVAALGALVWLGRTWWLRGMGEFLVRGEAPQKSDVAVVLAGDGYGHRLMRAVDLVRQGYAPIILVDGPLVAYGHNEAEMAIEWAIRQGVPREILAPAPMRARSTVAEVCNLNEELGRRGVKRALIVTSNFHTRRARQVFHRYGRKDIQYIVVASPDEDFDPADWWRSRDAKKVLLLEYAKLLNWWLE
jgi:uncharacterized SAM-binding protein YcdF (DUF218 family)